MIEKIKKPKKLSQSFNEGFNLFTSTDPIIRLSKDLKEASRLMKVREARYLVDLYYTFQDPRKAAGTQIDRCEEAEEPCDILRWVHGNQMKLEQDTKAVLGAFASQFKVGQWLQSIRGIGPVLSAGFLATFDVRGRKYAGQWWRFAGLDPSQKWLGREKGGKILRELGVDKSLSSDQVVELSNLSGYHVTKLMNVWENGIEIGGKRTKGKKGILNLLSLRPWNNRAKVLCYHAGELFVKTQNSDDSIYGKHFSIYRKRLDDLNDQGAFEKTAEERSKQVGKDTDAYKAYSIGKLPKGHLHARARRWIVKIFLSHFHTVCYRDYYQEEPPMPFVLSEHCKDGNHTHIIEVPECEVNGLSLRDFLGD